MPVNSRKQSQSSRRFYLFERCSGGILNLKFDSDILESFYSECSFPRARGRFRFGSAFIIVACAIWLLYFCVIQPHQWRTCVYILACGIILSGISLALSFVKLFFKKYYAPMSGVYATLCCLLSLSPFIFSRPFVSCAFTLSLSIQLVLLIYTMIPLRLWQLLLICGPLSFFHVLLPSIRYGPMGSYNILVNIVAHVCAHAIGVILQLMSQVWRRSTFLRLGYSALMHKELRKEKEIRDDMIRSLMPNEVAQEVMRDVGGEASLDEVDSVRHGTNKSSSQKRRSRQSHDEVNLSGDQNLDDLAAGILGFSDEFDDDEEEEEEASKKNSVASNTDVEKRGAFDELDTTTSQRPSLVPKGTSPPRTVTFRKFHVSQLENVSVLFADIVGFTKMSSNKTASHLVYLLNDLFGRFDRLCELTGCEKIATLGDCYYCVSGCPNPVADHAERAVETGRAMCAAIQQFDEDHKESVNMRVGVHTGKVICGLVGTRRFKFDVWSNDVTLANEMESTGQAGKVHISEATYAFVKDIYEVSDGEPVQDIRKFKVLVEFFNKEQQCFAIKHTQDEALLKTYFVERRFDDKPPCTTHSDAMKSSGDRALELESPNAAAIPLITAQQDLDANELGSDGQMNSTLSTALQRDLNPADQGPTTTGAAAVAPPPGRRSDAEMLEALQDAAKVEDVFTFPPISPFTLNFRSRQVEFCYRRLGLGRPKGPAVQKLSWSTPRIAPLINGTSEFVLFVFVLLTCFVVFPDSRMATHSPTFYIVAGLGLIINILFMTLLFADLAVWCFRRKRNTSHPSVRRRDWRRCILRAYMICFRWPLRNVIGALVLILPSAVILANFNGSLFTGLNSYPPLFVATYRSLIGLLFSFMLINFTLFISFSFWTKSLTASLSCLIAMILLALPSSQLPQVVLASDSWPAWVNPVLHKNFVWEMEVILLITLALVVSLNREFDVSFRLSFHRDYEALKTKQAIAQQKVQADWLLENIIPYYIMDDLRQTQKYSQHIEDAAVVFATISNFADFYDEQYQGGQEMLRVLNEIFADFEHLLASPKYKDVEKIKTIGACFMAASGLNLANRARNKRPDAHLWAMMDFALDLVRTLDDFNRQMFNFQFEMKVGYNIGEVTAGVIGTTKLLYDIWGDTVNVASRMYSTGQKGRIQVTEAVAQRLESRYVFEYRGEVFVKGKGDMKTYLLVERRTSQPQE